MKLPAIPFRIEPMTMADIPEVIAVERASYSIGHVDFTGKVTRAIRTIDGVVVLVDAVEEIMAQTEILTRQAVEQRVRPVLFINKVDRLIEELHLSPDQIEKKLRRIINGLNDLIALYAEEAFRKEWKIEPSKGNVPEYVMLKNGKWIMTLIYL